MHGEPTETEQVERERAWEQAVGRRFRDLDGDAPARILLEQVADTSFALLAGFRYRAGDGHAITVRPEDLRHGRTDLASVPRALTWFVGRSGRHTPAALLHDALLHRAERTARETDVSPLPGYEHADAVFLEALASLEVPPLRRTTMWAAVTFGTRLRAGGAATAAIVAWLVASLLGTTALGLGLVAGAPGIVVAALLAPVVGALLWGRQVLAGVVAGYAAVFVALPTAIGALGLLVARAADAVLTRLTVRRRRPPG